MKKIITLMAVAIIFSCNRFNKKSNNENLNPIKKTITHKFNFDNFYEDAKNCNQINIYSLCSYVSPTYKLESKCNFIIGMSSESVIASYNGVDSIKDKTIIGNIIDSMFRGIDEYKNINGSDLRVVLKLIGKANTYNLGIDEKSILINDSIYIKSDINPLEILLKNSPETFKIFDSKYKFYQEIITYDTLPSNDIKDTKD